MEPLGIVIIVVLCLGLGFIAVIYYCRMRTLLHDAIQRQIEERQEVRRQTRAIILNQQRLNRSRTRREERRSGRARDTSTAFYYSTRTQRVYTVSSDRIHPRPEEKEEEPPPSYWEVVRNNP